MAIYPCVKHNFWPGYLCAKCNGDEPEQRGEEMKRYEWEHDVGMCEEANGEYIRYDDHIDAMKRIAGEGREPQGMAAAGWFALVDGAAAALEDAANHCGTVDSEAAALVAAAHYRARAQELLDADKKCRTCGHAAHPGTSCVNIAPSASAQQVEPMCRVCNGRGMVNRWERVGESDFNEWEEDCPVCGGAGNAPEHVQKLHDQLVATRKDLHNVQMRIATADIRKLLAASSPADQGEDAREVDGLKPGCCHKCGMPLSQNPHPEAGKPDHYLEVGCPKECIPCTVKGRHNWASQAMKNQRDAERYRYLRNEAWGLDKRGRADVHVCQFGPGVLMSAITELAEEALDAVIDAAMSASKEGA